MDAELFSSLQQFVTPIVEAIDKNTDKSQELLERLECIDNALDDIKDTADKDFRENILEWLRRIHQQGQP